MFVSHCSNTRGSRRSTRAHGDHTRSFAQRQSGRMDSDDGDLDIRGVGHAPRANDEDGSSDDADISNLEEKLEQISQMISAEDMPSGSASVSNSHLHASTSVNPSVHVSHSGVGGDDSGQAPFNLDGERPAKAPLFCAPRSGVCEAKKQKGPSGGSRRRTRIFFLFRTRIFFSPSCAVQNVHRQNPEWRETPEVVIGAPFLKKNTSLVGQDSKLLHPRRRRTYMHQEPRSGATSRHGGSNGPPQLCDILVRDLVAEKKRCFPERDFGFERNHSHARPRRDD